MFTIFPQIKTGTGQTPGACYLMCVPVKPMYISIAIILQIQNYNHAIFNILLLVIAVLS